MLLMVHLDSESLPWLEQQIGSGNLPNLAALMRGSTRLPVTDLLLAGLPYPSFYSGVAPAGHGFYFPFQWVAEEQTVRVWNTFEHPPSALERADAAGARVVVLDPPEYWPIRMRNGYCESGVQFRSRVLLHPWSTDPVRAEKLRARLGPAPRADEVFGRPSRRALVSMRQALLEAPRRLGAAAAGFLSGSPPDCLWLNFCALHIGAHQFFDLRTLPRAEDRRGLETTREEIAGAYDRVLGEVLSRAPAGTDVLVFYFKGMGPATGWGDLLPEMLRRVLGEPEARDSAAALRRIVPQSVRSFVADRLPDGKALALTARASTPRADWSRCRAFALPTDCPGFVRLNLRGREREGIVAPGDAPALLEQIASGLQTFCDEDGDPCVERFLRPEQIAGQGAKAGNFPDLLVMWRSKPNLLARGVRSAAWGEVLRRGVTNGRSGYHCPGALAFAHPSRMRVAPPGRAIEPPDIAATLLAALGLPHHDLPGVPLLTDAAIAAQPSGS